MNIKINTVNARFGPSVPDFVGLQGYIAIADPYLSVFVFNAQNGGYVAVVIINSQDFTMDELLKKLFNGVYNICIPTIFIERSNAETLKQFSFESKSYLSL